VWEAVRPYTMWVREAGLCRLRDGWWYSGRGGAAHANERKRAARVDRDASRAVELGDVAVAIAKAGRAGAGERGGLPGGEVHTADTIVEIVLRCGGHAERGATQ
jgi:hypothetical protein